MVSGETACDDVWGDSLRWCLGDRLRWCLGGQLAMTFGGQLVMVFGETGCDGV